MHVQVAADVAELDQLRQLALARGGQLAAVLAQLRRRCTACRAARRPPPRWRRRASRRSRRRRSRTRSRAARACTASVRSASLCFPEPVKCWSRFPKASSGTTRRSTGMPVWVTARAPGRARASAPRRSRRAPRRPRPGPRGRAVAATTSRSLQVSAMPARAARQLHPRGVRLAGRPRSPRPTASAWDSRKRVRGAPASSAASAASTFSSALAPKPGTSASRPASAASRSSSSEVTPRCSWSSAHALRPEPRDARDLHEAGRDPAPSACPPTGSMPPSSSASIFSAIVLPTPASSSALPGARQLGHRHARPRGSPSRRCGRPRPGRPPRRRARTGSPARRSASAISAFRMVRWDPGARVRGRAGSLADPADLQRGREHRADRPRGAAPSWPRPAGEHRILIVDDNSPDGTGADRRPAGRRASTRSRCSTARAREGSAPPTSPASHRALDGGADLVLEMDSDFSHDPADLPRLIAAGRGRRPRARARATCRAAA